MNAIDEAYVSFLVDAARHGNQDAFATLYRMFRSPVYKWLRARLDESSAEDVVQESFYRAYRYIRTLRDAGQFGPWILRIARNLYNDWVAKNGVQTQPLVRIDELAEVIADKGQEDVAERLDVEAILAAVPAGYARFLELHFLQGFTVPEISLATGLPVSTVKWRIHRAVQLGKAAAGRQQADRPTDER